MAKNTDKIVGRIKKAAGELTDNEDLEKQGASQEAAGKAWRPRGREPSTTAVQEQIIRRPRPDTGRAAPALVER